MTPALICVLALAVWVALRPPGGPGGRLRRQLAGPRSKVLPGFVRGTERRPVEVPMTVLVQQLASLLKGGRTPSRLWDELWLLYGAGPPPDRAGSDFPPRGPALGPASLASLAAARAAARCGAPVGEAIRRAAAGGLTGRGPARGVGSGAREQGAWLQLAACFDVAEASGCALADVLTRFAAQLDAADDAEAARETALAGPRATVRLLSWLPVLGLGVGTLLGVDPLKILLGTSEGLAALAAGAFLTTAGRIWSNRLVRSAAGQPR